MVCQCQAQGHLQMARMTTLASCDLKKDIAKASLKKIPLITVE